MAGDLGGDSSKKRDGPLYLGTGESKTCKKKERTRYAENQYGQ